jgi:hypothetical protein
VFAWWLHALAEDMADVSCSCQTLLYTRLKVCMDAVLLGMVYTVHGYTTSRDEQALACMICGVYRMMGPGRIFGYLHSVSSSNVGLEDGQRACSQGRLDNVVTTLDPSQHSRGIALRLFGVNTHLPRQSTLPCLT